MTRALEMPSGSSGTWRSDLVVKSCGSHSQATSDDLWLVKTERLLLYSRMAGLSMPLGNLAGYFIQTLSLPLCDSSD